MPVFSSPILRITMSAPEPHEWGTKLVKGIAATFGDIHPNVLAE